MPKFRKKPVVIEAMQVVAKPLEMAKLAMWLGTSAFINGDEVQIETLEGTMKGSVGDWIIRGVKGEYYPCKPDIFDATYEPVSYRAND